MPWGKGLLRHLRKVWTLAQTVQEFQEPRNVTGLPVRGGVYDGQVGDDVLAQVCFIVCPLGPQPHPAIVSPGPQ